MMRLLLSFTLAFFLTAQFGNAQVYIAGSAVKNQANATAGFTAPDTVCVNSPVNITNTSVGASTYYWNFCVGNLNNPPIGTNLGNIGGNFVGPVYMDYVQENGNYYGFVTDNYSGKLLRLDFGNNLLNTPAITDLGNLGVIRITVEGLQVVKNEGKWYVIIVGGQVGIYTPDCFLIKVELGTSITNPAPVATNWGNLGNMAYPHDLYVFNDGPNWYGLTVNTDNNTITRFDFTTSFSNTPTATNLGNIGNLGGPTGIHAINDNGNWYAFITNARNFTVTRLDFGNSLLNTPTGQNLGNIGGTFTVPWDIYIIKFCGELLGYMLDAGNYLVKLDFKNSITNNSPVATKFGNIGNLNFPHCLSKIFRAGADLYTFVPNVLNSSLSRIQFPGCTNSSIPNSTAQNPPPVIYNTPGTYNINLTIDDGLPTQTAFCKQVVVLPSPVQSPTQHLTFCGGGKVKIGTGTKNATYLWNTGATTDSIEITSPGTYWVQISRFSCKVTDTIIANSRLVSDFGFKQDVCNPNAVQFYNAGTGSANPWWDLGDGTILSGVTTLNHTYTAFGDYKVRFSVSDGICTDTVTKIISIKVVKENIVLTSDTVICIGTTKQLLATQALNYCWTPATYLDNPAIQNPVTSTPQNITYYLNTETAGNNIIVNGDFSAGNTGFTSEYNFANPNITEGQYFIGTNPQAWNVNLSKCGDHTTGSGNMMLVNGSPAIDANIWKQTITVTPNTNYAFATWIQSVSSPNPAQLKFSINGKDIGNLIFASSSTCTWTLFYSTWNSGNSTTAVISIVNKNTIREGNDFALDDISFAPVLIKRDSVTITVEKPSVKTNQDTLVCINRPVPLHATGAAGYTWTPADGLSNTTIADPVATPAVPGSTMPYIVTGTTVNGCIAKDTVKVSTYAKPGITKTPDTTICRNVPLQLFATGGQSYLWTPPSTLNNPAISNPLAKPVNELTTYFVQITDAISCTYNDSVEVALHPLPHFTAQANVPVCLGNTVTLIAGGGDTYLWSPASFLDNAAIPNPKASPDITTQYAVHIEESVCHFDTTINVTVTVNPNPVVTAQKSNDIDCSSPTSQLLASGAGTYLWSPSAGVDDPKKRDPIASIDTTTIFYVQGTNQFGCTTEASIKVRVSAENTPIFAVPNAFTPNGDRHNQCFGIRKWGNVTILEFAVYNRWGEKIFTTNNPSQCWDGTYKGIPQVSGGYVYVIRARGFCGEIKRTGMVMLIR